MQKATVKKSKEYTLFMNLFWQAMSVMHRVNENDNISATYYACSLLNTLQWKNEVLIEKNVNQILETFIRWTCLKTSWLLQWIN